MRNGGHVNCIADLASELVTAFPATGAFALVGHHSNFTAALAFENRRQASLGGGLI
jgi:hypothetical protein